MDGREEVMVQRGKHAAAKSYEKQARFTLPRMRLRQEGYVYSP